jgi:hypothetical protein
MISISVRNESLNKGAQGDVLNMLSTSSLDHETKIGNFEQLSLEPIGKSTVNFSPAHLGIRLVQGSIDYKMR